METSVLWSQYDKEIMFLKNRRRKIRNLRRKIQEKILKKTNQNLKLGDQETRNKNDITSCNSINTNSSIQGISDKYNSSFNSDSIKSSTCVISNKDNIKSLTCGISNKDNIKSSTCGTSNKDNIKSSTYKIFNKDNISFNSDNVQSSTCGVSNKESSSNSDNIESLLHGGSNKCISVYSNNINSSIKETSNVSCFYQNQQEKNNDDFYAININFCLKEINKSNFGLQINFDVLFQNSNFFILGDFLLKYKRICIKFTKNFFNIFYQDNLKENFINIMYMLNKTIHAGFQLNLKSNIKIALSINLFKNIRLDFFNLLFF